MDSNGMPPTMATGTPSRALTEDDTIAVPFGDSNEFIPLTLHVQGATLPPGSLPTGDPTQVLGSVIKSKRTECPCPLPVSFSFLSKATAPYNQRPQLSVMDSPSISFKLLADKKTHVTPRDVATLALWGVPLSYPTWSRKYQSMMRTYENVISSIAKPVMQQQIKRMLSYGSQEEEFQHQTRTGAKDSSLSKRQNRPRSLIRGNVNDGIEASSSSSDEMISPEKGPIAVADVFFNRRSTAQELLESYFSALRSRDIRLAVYLNTIPGSASHPPVVSPKWASLINGNHISNVVVIYVNGVSYDEVMDSSVGKLVYRRYSDLVLDERNSADVTAAVDKYIKEEQKRLAEECTEGSPVGCIDCRDLPVRVRRPFNSKITGRLLAPLRFNQCCALDAPVFAPVWSPSQNNNLESDFFMRPSGNSSTGNSRGGLNSRGDASSGTGEHIEHSRQNEARCNLHDSNLSNDTNGNVAIVASSGKSNSASFMEFIRKCKASGNGIPFADDEKDDDSTKAKEERVKGKRPRPQYEEVHQNIHSQTSSLVEHPQCPLIYQNLVGIIRQHLSSSSLLKAACDRLYPLSRALAEKGDGINENLNATVRHCSTVFQEFSIQNVSMKMNRPVHSFHREAEGHAVKSKRGTIMHVANETTESHSNDSSNNNHPSLCGDVSLRVSDTSNACTGDKGARTKGNRSACFKDEAKTTLADRTEMRALNCKVDDTFFLNELLWNTLPISFVGEELEVKRKYLFLPVLKSLSIDFICSSSSEDKGLECENNQHSEEGDQTGVLEKLCYVFKIPEVPSCEGEVTNTEHGDSLHSGVSKRIDRWCYLRRTVHNVSIGEVSTDPRESHQLSDNSKSDSSLTHDGFTVRPTRRAKRALESFCVALRKWCRDREQTLLETVCLTKELSKKHHPDMAPMELPSMLNEYVKRVAEQFSPSNAKLTIDSSRDDKIESDEEFTSILKGRSVFAFDCEMVQGEDRVSMLARATIVHIPSGIILIDQIVKPRRKIVDYITRFSGITPEMMDGEASDVSDDDTGEQDESNSEVPTLYDELKALDADDDINSTIQVTSVQNKHNKCMITINGSDEFRIHRSRRIDENTPTNTKSLAEQSSLDQKYWRNGNSLNTLWRLEDVQGIFQLLLDYNSSHVSSSNSRSTHGGSLGEYNSDVYIIGHSMDNDFKACQILAGNDPKTDGENELSNGRSTLRIIDTSFLFPHPARLPFKNSLRFLAKTYLHKAIQQGSHNSLEDATVCAELVLTILIKGFEFGSGPTRYPCFHFLPLTVKGEGNLPHQHPVNIMKGALNTLFTSSTLDNKGLFSSLLPKDQSASLVPVKALPPVFPPLCHIPPTQSESLFSATHEGIPGESTRSDAPPPPLVFTPVATTVLIDQPEVLRRCGVNIPRPQLTSSKTGTGGASNAGQIFPQDSRVVEDTVQLNVRSASIYEEQEEECVCENSFSVRDKEDPGITQEENQRRKKKKHRSHDDQMHHIFSWNRRISGGDRDAVRKVVKVLKEQRKKEDHFYSEASIWEQQCKETLESVSAIGTEMNVSSVLGANTPCPLSALPSPLRKGKEPDSSSTVTLPPIPPKPLFLWTQLRDACDHFDTTTATIPKIQGNDASQGNGKENAIRSVPGPSSIFYRGDEIAFNAFPVPVGCVNSTMVKGDDTPHRPLSLSQEEQHIAAVEEHLNKPLLDIIDACPPYSLILVMGVNCRQENGNRLSAAHGMVFAMIRNDEIFCDNEGEENNSGKHSGPPATQRKGSSTQYRQAVNNVVK